MLKTKFEDRGMIFDPLEFHAAGPKAFEQHPKTMWRISRKSGEVVGCFNIENRKAHSRAALSARFDFYRFPAAIDIMLYDGDQNTMLHWDLDEMTGEPLKVSKGGEVLWTIENHLAAPDATAANTRDAIISATGIDAADWWYPRIWEDPAMAVLSKKLETEEG